MHVRFFFLTISKLFHVYYILLYTFSCILLISNHMIFLVQFEINKHLKIFQRPQIALAPRARAILLVFENFTRAYSFQIALVIMWLPILIFRCIFPHRLTCTVMVFFFVKWISGNHQTQKNVWLKLTELKAYNLGSSWDAVLKQNLRWDQIWKKLFSISMTAWWIDNRRILQKFVNIEEYFLACIFF